jgi:hypothetical protein
LPNAIVDIGPPRLVGISNRGNRSIDCNPFRSFILKFGGILIAG